MAQVSAPLTDQRRFSSVLLVHPNLTDSKATVDYLQGSLSALADCKIQDDEWTANRCEYVSGRNYYPDSVGDPEARKRDHGYAHQVYVASRRLAPSQTNMVLLASPYVRLLQRMVTDISRRLPAPGLQFYSLDMTGIYRAFEGRHVGLTATKVTLQMLSQPGLELVSLTGRNPLDSELHDQIKNVAAPYALRTEVILGDHKARVNIDRHGNIWWFQTDEAKIGIVLSLISRLASINSLRMTRTMPLDRAEPDDEEP